jgi:hypothetical protein
MRLSVLHLVPAEAAASRHATHDLNGLEADPLEAVIESSVGDELLQEGDEHARAVLVGHGQVLELILGICFSRKISTKLNRDQQ